MVNIPTNRPPTSPGEMLRIAYQEDIIAFVVDTTEINLYSDFVFV